MKSLKRTLSLVLALVMVLGLFGGISMSAAAAEFTDDKDVQYDEAVDVMTAIGAINGMGDGTFQPKANITRAQAAKLVAYTVLGQDAAERLSGVTSSFTDVDANDYDWAIPSIEYLRKAGVIDGRDETTFDPEGKITGYEVGKMLLCSLGYGAKGEYTGPQWELQVAIDGNKLSAATVSSASTGRLAVFSNRADDATVLSGAASREEVALYCFNTIQKGKVEYISTLDVYSDGTNTLGITLGTIASNVYPKLTCKPYSSTGEDKMGNPANEWTYKDKDIGAYTVKPAVTFTTAQTEATLKAALKGYKDPEKAFSSVENNKNAKTESITHVSDVVSYLQFDATNNGKSGNGVVVNIYADESNKITNVVVAAYDLTKVSSINAAAKSVTLTSANENPLQGTYTITEENQPELYAKVSGLAVDDYVIVTPVYNRTATTAPFYAAGAVETPAQVTGKISSVSSAGTITFDDGKSYTNAKNRDFTDATPDIGNEVTVLLDSMGHVVHWKAATTPTATTTYGFVLEKYSTLTDGKIVNMVKAALADGTIKDIPAGVKGNLTTSLNVGELYKLEDKTSSTGLWEGAAVGETLGTGDYLAAAPGKAKDTAAAGKVVALVTYDNSTAEKGTVDATDKTLLVKNNNASATANNGYYYNNFYDSDVKFVFISHDTTTGAWSASASTGVTACEIPAYTKGTMSYAVIEKASAGDSTPVVKAMFINQGEKSVATDPNNVLFIPDTSKYTAISALDVNGSKKTVYNYTALVNGEPIDGGATIANLAKDNTTAGFYTFAESSTIDGAYDVKKLTDGAAFSANNVTGIEDIVNHHAPYFTVAGTGAPSDGLVNLTSAKIVDIRSTADQIKTPITATVAGLQKALTNSDLTLGILYDTTKGGLASVVYICNATEVKTLTLPEVKATADTTATEGKWSTTAVSYGDTVKLTVTGDNGLQNNLKLTVTNAKIVGCSLDNSKVTIAADGLSATIAAADAKVEITYTIWLNTADNPTVVFSDAA